jgi:hypothetical protein
MNTIHTADPLDVFFSCWYDDDAFRYGGDSCIGVASTQAKKSTFGPDGCAEFGAVLAGQ